MSDEAIDSGGWGWSQWLAAFGGFVAGFLLDWLAIAFGIFSIFVIYEEADNALSYVLLTLGFLIVPVAAVFALAKRRLRVPFLIGLAAGSIVGSGVCAGFWVSNA